MIKVKNKNKIIYLLIAGVILLAIVLFSLNNANNLNGNYYRSKTMKLIIDIPNTYQIEDKQISIDLKKDNSSISIVGNGTNYSNLDDYLVNFDSRRKITVSEASRSSINGYDAISRIVSFPNENITQKSYYIFVSNTVYIFSTSSQELYGDLDQIAKSFKYTGN